MPFPLWRVWVSELICTKYLHASQTSFSSDSCLSAVIAVIPYYFNVYCQGQWQRALVSNPQSAAKFKLSKLKQGGGGTDIMRNVPWFHVYCHQQSIQLMEDICIVFISVQLLSQDVVYTHCYTNMYLFTQYQYMHACINLGMLYMNFTFFFLLHDLIYNAFTLCCSVIVMWKWSITVKCRPSCPLINWVVIK